MKWGIKNKRIFLLIITLITFLLSACSPTREIACIPSNTETKAVENIGSETNSNTLTTSSPINTEIETPQTEKAIVSSTNQAMESTTKNTEKAADSSVPTKVEQEKITTQAKLNNTSVRLVSADITQQLFMRMATISLWIITLQTERQ